MMVNQEEGKTLFQNKSQHGIIKNDKKMVDQQHAIKQT